jgi:hypothetical protein
MSHRTLIVLGAAILAASTLLFSLWTVQIFVVPTVIVLVLFGMLFSAPRRPPLGISSFRPGSPRGAGTTIGNRSGTRPPERRASFSAR